MRPAVESQLRTVNPGVVGSLLQLYNTGRCTDYEGLPPEPQWTVVAPGEAGQTRSFSISRGAKGDDASRSDLSETLANEHG